MKTKTLQMAIRIIGMIQLVLGIIFWTGNADKFVIVHILLGLILTIALFMLTFRAYRAGVLRWLVILAAVWAVGLPAWGLLQEKIFPESLTWLAQVLHLVCGLGAVGIGEMLAMHIGKKNA